MRIRLRGIFWTLACMLAGLALPQQGRAGGDDTNAALIPGTDGTTWAQNMHQVMGGASTMLPGGSTIRGPVGIYANVLLSDKIEKALKVVCPTGMCPNKVDLVAGALNTYFGYLLDNPAVSGLLLQAQWQDLQPSDPGPDPSAPTDTPIFNYIDAAFNAIITWNKEHPSKPPKTLQLDVTPGFNSPLTLNTLKQPGSDWLLNYLSSCDGLFTPPMPVSSACGYTKIFYRTENNPVVQIPLPMPWNPTYKAYWKAFLSALSQHIASDPDYVSSFVSIGVAGPTASSTEIILPNGRPGTADLPNRNAGPLTVPGSGPVTVYQAWNCLLGNAYGVPGNCLLGGYGATSSYINSDRAFVEEWAAAIDMYGEIFSGVTLEVTTGNGLPDFCTVEASLSGWHCVPAAPNPYFFNPPPAFTPDCGSSSTTTMDCAAETAILAYFAGPPIGGANAKGTASAGLTARSNSTPEQIPSANRVKWLSLNTTAPQSVLNSSSGSWAVVSHMLGGLQFAKSFYTHPAFEGCEKGTTCTISPEDALLNVLKAYFAGTSLGDAFPGGSNTAMNGSETIVDAPINYLQIWDTDIQYAAGWINCTWPQLMTPPAKKGEPPPGCTVEDMSTHTTSTSILGSKLTAQQLLNFASEWIPSQTVPVSYSPTCCVSPYVLRGAFQGDLVCVTSGEAGQVMTDNNNAAAGTTYSMNYTDKTFYKGYTFVPSVPNGIVPYGICKSGLQYRLAYMGDYVCVSSSQARQVAADNAASVSRRLICPVSPAPRPPRPIPLPR
jgi:hypothetical protein